MNTLVLIWYGLGILLLLAEFMVPGAVLGFVGAAALLTGVLVQIGLISGLLEVTLAFLFSAIVFIAVLRTALLRFFPDDSTVQNTDETLDALGQMVEVIDSIAPEITGRVRYLGVSWAARSDALLNKGDYAIITAQEGQTWWVTPAKPNESTD